jgi:hypothetical protein
VEEERSGCTGWEKQERGIVGGDVMLFKGLIISVSSEKLLINPAIHGNSPVCTG